MGGLGSGRYSWGTRQTVEGCNSIDARECTPDHPLSLFSMRYWRVCMDTELRSFSTTLRREQSTSFLDDACTLAPGIGSRVFSCYPVVIHKKKKEPALKLTPCRNWLRGQDSNLRQGG